MAGITIPCYGVCGGDPKWRDPSNGLGCCLCGCSGFVTVYNQRELAEKDWADHLAKQAAKAKKADNKKRRVA